MHEGTTQVVKTLSSEVVKEKEKGKKQTNNMQHGSGFSSFSQYSVEIPSRLATTFQIDNFTKLVVLSLTYMYFFS